MFRSVRFSRVLFRQNAKKVENVLPKSFISMRSIAKPPLLERLRDVKPTGYITLVFPIATLALGVWQIKRTMWKRDIIAVLESRVRQKPIPLPDNLEEIAELEYTPVKVKGHFDHSREIVLGPRTRINHTGAASTLISNSALAGFNIYTPFKPDDKDYYILVNRGWVPAEKKDPKTREGGQIKEEVELVGLIRLAEKKPQFVLDNKPEEGFWIYRDVYNMASFADTAPICIDAIEDSTVPDGPIGGQTLINLRNAHFSYSVTWLTLSILSGMIWWSNNVPHPVRKLR